MSHIICYTYIYKYFIFIYALVLPKVMPNYLIFTTGQHAIYQHKYILWAYA